MKATANATVVSGAQHPSSRSSSTDGRVHPQAVVRSDSKGEHGKATPPESRTATPSNSIVLRVPVSDCVPAALDPKGGESMGKHITLDVRVFLDDNLTKPQASPKGIAKCSAMGAVLTGVTLSASVALYLINHYDPKSETVHAVGTVFGIASFLTAAITGIWAKCG